MQKLTELVVGLLVIFAVRKGITDPEEYQMWRRPVRTFMDPVDFRKRTCPDGFVQDVDYLIISGVVNVTDIGHPPLDACVLVFYEEGGGFTHIWKSRYHLGKEPCVDLKRVPATSCRCLAQDAKQIRIKCNITMKTEYHRSIFALAYLSNTLYVSAASERLPNVYNDSSCLNRNISSRNHGSSLLGSGNDMSVIGIIFTAFVIPVSSLFSFDQ
ncbi:unnamed protein product [Lymnaea stagnalis]|uniref:Uncharacterized protein n=1 Tax=Lymnaea stagnalis TaxID=6523 RepID=A0AAV2GZ70_LYMST